MQDAIPEALRQALHAGFRQPFDAQLKIDVADGPDILVDGAPTPPVISVWTEKSPAHQCEWRATRETLLRALDSDRALANAFVSGRLVALGDMAVLGRLHLGAPSSPS